MVNETIAIEQFLCGSCNIGHYRMFTTEGLRLLNVKSTVNRSIFEMHTSWIYPRLWNRIEILDAKECPLSLRKLR